MARKPPKNRGVGRALVERLEDRQLLSADLTGSFVDGIPGALSLHRNNEVTVHVKNIGNAAADGPVTVALYAAVNTTLDSYDTPLATTVAQTVHLNPHKGIDIPIKFATPTSAPDGKYYLLADILPGATIADGNLANNVIASPATVSIQQPFVDLAGSVSNDAPATVNIGGTKHQASFTVFVTVTNQGNVLATGPLTISVYAATHQTLNATDTLLGSKSYKKVFIPVGISRNYTIAVTPSANDPSGTFYILADINSSNSIAESDTANNIVSPAATVVFNNPLIAPGPYMVGALSSSVSSVYVGEPTQDQFTLSLGRAGPNTSVEVDEFNAAGKDLGKIVQLEDNGQAANGDAVADDGIYSGSATIMSSSVGTRYFAAILSDPQLKANVQSSTLSISASVAPTPMLAGPLISDTQAVIVGQSALTRFNVDVANASPFTTVQVDEFDANGNNLGEITPLLDNGNPANDDAVAGDGIFSGVNTIAAPAAGDRYFAAVVTDSLLLSSPIQSPTIAIAEVNAPSRASLQTDITDNAALNADAASVINAGGSNEAAIGAVQAALQGDGNVLPGTIQTTATSIEWQTIDGTFQGVSTDFLSTQGDLGSPTGPAPAAQSAAPTDETADPSDSDTAGDPTEKALILSPFASSLSQYDPSAEIDSQFAAANYSVTYHTDAQVTFADFENLGQYAAISLFGHGTQLGYGGEGIYTSMPASIATSQSEAGDLLNNRVALMNGYYVITPSFITAYAGDMNGAIVEFNCCSSLYGTQMGNAFVAQGAGAYIGYSNSVKAGFAAGKATATWQTLLGSTDNTVGDIPGINIDHDTNTPPAVFTEIGPLSATLPQPDLLKDNEVYVQYNWPQNVSDLDSNTGFLGESVGFDLPGGQYLHWSGDNTGPGGSETTTVDIDQAWLDGAWSGSTAVSAGAAWFTPAGGSGPAYVTIALKNTTTGALTHVSNQTVNPGQEAHGTMTAVGTINVILGGNPANPTVTINWTQS